MTPETTAKQALHDALVAAFAADDDAEVSYGPPPADAVKPKQVWTGGVSASEETGSLRGSAGPGIDERFTVEVNVDASTADPAPSGAATVDDLAYAMLKTVRDVVRDQVRSGPDIDLGTSRSILRWSRVVSHVSAGPLPIEDASGWACAITTDIEFVTRIRGV